MIVSGSEGIYDQAPFLVPWTAVVTLLGLRASVMQFAVASVWHFLTGPVTYYDHKN